MIFLRYKYFKNSVDNEEDKKDEFVNKEKLLDREFKWFKNRVKNQF